MRTPASECAKNHALTGSTTPRPPRTRRDPKAYRLDLFASTPKFPGVLRTFREIRLVEFCLLYRRDYAPARGSSSVHVRVRAYPRVYARRRVFAV